MENYLQMVRNCLFFITGDTHGNQYKWVEQIECDLSPADIILICGDFGVGFWNGRYWSEETFYDFDLNIP